MALGFSEEIGVPTAGASAHAGVELHETASLGKLEAQKGMQMAIKFSLWRLRISVRLSITRRTRSKKLSRR